MKTKYSALTVVLAAVALSATGRTQAPHSIEPAAEPVIPRTWDDAVMPTLEVPLSHPVGSPKPVSADYYYKIPVRPIYKQYPVYAPGREPAGYMEWLRKQDPVILWDDANHKPKLETRSRPGSRLARMSSPRHVFSDAGDQSVIALADIKSTAWYFRERRYPPSPKTVSSHSCTTSSGKKERSSWAASPAPCAHTRVMPKWRCHPRTSGKFSSHFELIPYMQLSSPLPSASDPALPYQPKLNQALFAATLAASRSDPPPKSQQYLRTN